MRKICVVTGTRAEYGLLRWVMQEIKDDPDLVLQIIATGMHLSPEFGLTYHEIEGDNFDIDYKVEMLLSSDTSVGVCKSMGLGLISFADAFSQLQPDLIVVLGDRFEIFTAVSAALIARIPVAHIHGGEATEGLVDEAIRHSITKMAHLHFVATDDYRQRVIQLGEHPERVFLVGGLGVDGIKRSVLLGKFELENSLKFKFNTRNLLITFHPVTLEESTQRIQVEELLSVLSGLEDTGMIFTLPNADSGGRELIQIIQNFVAQHPNARAYTSLGYLRYLSLLAHVDGVIGNSSSGLIEAPSFKKGTINIGDRQRGRIQAASIINCEPTRESIRCALDKLYSSQFQDSLQYVENPYGEGNASQKIVSNIKTYPLDGILKKRFFNLPRTCV